ncbi:MAG: DUF1737 domain-containing protein [Desulfobacterales bacterium]|nr:DUF1737 domain-containing protein [Desulfobacterales bacterium]
MYKVIEDRNKGSFEKKVNDAIKEGFTPIGGVAVDGDQNYLCYYQAMQKVVKTDDKN